MNEEALIRRLVADGDGLGDDRRLQNVYKLVLAFTNSETPKENREEAQVQIQSLLDQALYGMNKTTSVYQMHQLQAERYQNTLSTIETDIKDAQERINDCKQQLQDAKQIRKHRQEYDLMAKMIEEHPTRADSQEKLQEVNVELEKLEATRRQLEDAIDRRKKQLHCFLTEAMFLEEDIKDDLEDDSTSAEGPAAAPENGENMEVS